MWCPAAAARGGDSSSSGEGGSNSSGGGGSSVQATQERQRQQQSSSAAVQQVQQLQQPGAPPAAHGGRAADGRRCISRKASQAQRRGARRGNAPGVSPRQCRRLPGAGLQVLRVPHAGASRRKHAGGGAGLAGAHVTLCSSCTARRSGLHTRHSIHLQNLTRATIHQNARKAQRPAARHAQRLFLQACGGDARGNGNHPTSVKNRAMQGCKFPTTNNIAHIV